jgi:hypothetical protein
MALYPQVKTLTKTNQNQDNSSGWIPGELRIWFSTYAAGLTFNAVSTTPDARLWLNGLQQFPDPILSTRSGESWSR